MKWVPHQQGFTLRPRFFWWRHANVNANMARLLSWGKPFRAQTFSVTSNPWTKNLTFEGLQLGFPPPAYPQYQTLPQIITLSFDENSWPGGALLLLHHNRSLERPLKHEILESGPGGRWWEGWYFSYSFSFLLPFCMAVSKARGMFPLVAHLVRLPGRLLHLVPITWTPPFVSLIPPQPCIMVRPHGSTALVHQVLNLTWNCHFGTQRFLTDLAGASRCRLSYVNSFNGTVTHKLPLHM